MDSISAEGKDEELRNWASFRGQTLSRTGIYHRTYLDIFSLPHPPLLLGFNGFVITDSE